MTTPSFPLLIQRFFAEHLLAQRNLSPNTIAAYRDTFRLLLGYLARHWRKPVDQLTLAALTPEAVLAFLDELERIRGNSVRTRNARLAAIHSFTRFALAHAGPEFLATGHRILAVPFKGGTKPMLGFMTRAEVTALLGAIDCTAWSGRRDHLLFSFLYNTGARISEALRLRAADIHGRVIQLHGKGRKQRTVPLWPDTLRQLRGWIRSNEIKPDAPLFANAREGQLTRAGAAFRLAIWVRKAEKACSSLRGRTISTHTFRHYLDLRTMLSRCHVSL